MGKPQLYNNIYSSNVLKKLPNGNAQNLIKVESTHSSVKSKFLTVADAEKTKNDATLSSDLGDAALPEIVAVIQQKSTFNFSEKTILVVDDVEFNLNLIEMFFKHTGAKLLLAANGKEALDICKLTPHIDIVLMDIQMPIMDGLEATREIRKLYPEMPVIAITAFVHSSDKQRCIDAGCVDFLPKPCSRKDLLMTVNKYL